MSLEQNIAALTAAVIELTNAIKAGGATTVPQAAAPVAPVAQRPAAAPQPVRPVSPVAPAATGERLVGQVASAPAPRP